MRRCQRSPALKSLSGCSHWLDVEGIQAFVSASPLAISVRVQCFFLDRVLPSDLCFFSMFLDLLMIGYDCL